MTCTEEIKTVLPNKENALMEIILILAKHIDQLHKDKQDRTVRYG